MVRKPHDITPHLERARDAPDDVARLEALLEAYRARPLPALVDLIALAGKRAALDHSISGSLSDQHTRWLGVAVLERPMDLEWLLANLITGRGEYSKERLAKLDSWPVDPRLSAGLLALADGKRLTSRGIRGFWVEAFRIINKQVHPGLAPILAPMLALDPMTEFEHSLLRRLRMLEAKLGKLVPPSPSNHERAVLDALATRLEVARHRAAEKTADDFLREIWAAPLDDAPREVFADWLMERGDPRGEFISLQIARMRRRRQAPPPVRGVTTLREVPPEEVKALARERALLAKHRREWAAPFEPFLSMPSSSFERGFLDTAAVHWRKLASMPGMMTHPAWSTVRHFEIDPEGEHACDAWVEHMIALGARRS